MKSILKDLQLESLIPAKLLPKELSVKMYQGCPMTSLYVSVGVTTIGVNRVRALCAYAEKKSVYGCSCS